MFRFPLEEQEPRVSEGGTARGASVEEFPASKGIAGVSMRCKPGGLRELHWHANAAEWAYVVSGACRTTIYHPDGRSATDEFGAGDVWYFPRGYGHSIQGIGDQECHFILIFDNGEFSENATFSLTDWIAQTPAEVVAASLGINVDEVAKFPDHEVYLPLGPVPPPAPAPSTPAPAGSQLATAQHHRFRLDAEEPRRFPGGTIRTVSSLEFPISKTMTGGVIELQPGAIRELHWHPNADEWQYYLEGSARMTVFQSQARSETVEFNAGDVGYVPIGNGHYLENTGNTVCRILVAFNDGIYQEIGLSAWLATNPDLLLETNLGLSTTDVAKFRKEPGFIVEQGRGWS